MLFYVMTFLLKILKIRFYFKKPKKNKILIFDKESKKFANHLFEKNMCTVFDKRYESINLFVLVCVICEHGFKKIKDNYKIKFIEIVDPVIVYTAIDNDIIFYKLKNFFINKIFIADQTSLKSEMFIKECEQYNRTNKSKLTIDHLFVFGQNEMDRYSKIIDAKIHISGHTTNNAIGVRKIKNKKFSILFINSGIKKKKLFPLSIKIFDNLIKIATKYNFNFLERPNETYITEYKKIFPSNNWNYLVSYSSKEKSSEKITRELIDEQDIIVFISSTLGFEAIARSARVLKFSKSFYTLGESDDILPSSYKKYKDIPFYSNRFELKDVNLLFNKVKNYSDMQWGEISKKFSNDLMVLDKDNMIKKKVIKEILTN